MKNFLPIIVALLLGLSPTYAAEATTGLIQITVKAYSELVYGRELDRLNAFTNACKLTEYDCSTLKPPVVVYGPLREGLYGKYRGKDIIFIIDGLYGYTRQMVLLHETIHYLQVKVNGLVLPGPAHDVCHAENESFTLTDKWLRSVGQYKLLQGPLWWKNYPYCRRWFDPNFGEDNPLKQWNSPII